MVSVMFLELPDRKERLGGTGIPPVREVWRSPSGCGPARTTQLRPGRTSWGWEGFFPACPAVEPTSGGEANLCWVWGEGDVSLNLEPERLGDRKSEEDA